MNPAEKILKYQSTRNQKDKKSEFGVHTIGCWVRFLLNYELKEKSQQRLKDEQLCCMLGRFNRNFQIVCVVGPSKFDKRFF